MFKRLGWAAMLVVFFAAPAMAQNPIDVGDAEPFAPGGGGHLCGAQGAGGVGDTGCDGILVVIPIAADGNIAGAPGTTTVTYTFDVLINVETGAIWEDTMLLAVNPIETPVFVGGNRGPNQDIANEIQHLEEMAAEAAGEAVQNLEIETNNKACAGVPLTLRHILCPQVL